MASNNEHGKNYIVRMHKKALDFTGDIEIILIRFVENTAAKHFFVIEIDTNNITMYSGNSFEAYFLYNVVTFFIVA